MARAWIVRAWTVRACTVIALPLWCAAAWSQAPGSTATARVAAKRCHSPHASVDACDDAIRWNPQDASLLVAMGDAQMRARHPADAARAYRRAATLAPSTPGIQQKIGNAEALLAKTKANAKARPPSLASATSQAAAKRFSNADPETQSH